MKKTIVVILVLLMLLTACAIKADMETLDRTPYEEKAEEAAKRLLAGEVEEVYAEFSDTLAKQLPLEILTVQIQQLAALNAYVKTLDVTSQTVDQYIVVDVFSELTSTNINTRISYTTEGKITGLYFANSPLTPALLPGEEEIQVGEHALAGRLMLPENDNAPVVILIAGSGSHGMDGMLGKAGNAPLRDIALGLQKQGIATIRYDKRFYSNPQLAAQYPQLTIQDEVLDDVDWILENISTFKGIDPSRVYLLGHSLGGMLVPDIATRHPQIKGILSLAGSPRKLEVIMEEQLLAQIEAADMTPEEKEAQRSSIQKEMESIRAGDEKSAPFGVPFSYWKSLEASSAPAVISSLTQPFFVLQGTEDVQIYVDRDFEAWKDLLKNRDNVTFKLYDGLNHLFMKSVSDDPLEDYNTPNHVDEQVIGDIAQWILSH